MGRLKPCFPIAHGKARVDENPVIKVLSYSISSTYGGVTRRSNTPRTKCFTIDVNVGLIRETFPTCWWAVWPLITVNR